MMVTVAEVIATIRQRHRWTQQDMAEQIGLSRSSIANAEAGRQDLPGSRLLDLLRSECLLVDVDHPDRTISQLAGQVQTLTALLRAAEKDAAEYRAVLLRVCDEIVEAAL